MRLIEWIHTSARDVRFGVRVLRRNPGFTCVVVLTLALAAGATTSIFSVVDHVLLRPLPFEDPDALVRVYGLEWREEAVDGTPDPMTGPVERPIIDAIRASRSIASVAGYSQGARTIGGPAGAERVGAVIADLALFNVLGVQPIAGRTFRPDDGADVAVISAALWRRRYHADPSLPGAAVDIGGRAFTVIGVMPDAFQFPYSAASILPGALPESRTDVWLPFEQPLRGRVAVIARLAEGFPRSFATAELDAIARRIQDERYSGTRLRVAVRLAPAVEEVVGPVRRSLWLLFAGIGLVLLAACANVANLMFARMTVRTREVVTRVALGAGRATLIRQFIAESLVLSLFGALPGILIARWLTRAIVVLGDGRIPRIHEVTIDWRAFGFTLLLATGAAILCGLAPAVGAARVDVQAGLREAGAGITMGTRRRALRDALIVAEVAIAFVLATGASLLMREVVRQLRLETGMNMRNVVTLHLSPPPPPAVLYAIENRVRDLAGIEAAGITQLLPLQNWGWFGSFEVPGEPVTHRMSAELRYVSPGYFGALGIPIVRGRVFSSRDSAGTIPVILVNEALARTYFPDRDVLGLVLDRGTIIGVVGDVTASRLDRPATPEVYYPAAQNVASVADIGFTLVVRTHGRAESVVGRIRDAVHDVDANLAVLNIRSMDEVRGDSMRELFFYRALVGAFAVLALGLAGIGLHGVIAFTVAGRTREFAVRLALGAGQRRLARLVFEFAARLCVAGIAIGAVTAAGASVLLGRAVPATSPAMHGPAQTYVIVAGTILALALISCVRPVLLAVRIDPAASLRHD